MSDALRREVAALNCDALGHKWHRWVGQMNALGRDYDECDRCGMRREVAAQIAALMSDNAAWDATRERAAREATRYSAPR